MKTRGITKTDFDRIVAVFDSWMGAPASDRPHPVFFYELGDHALVVEDDDQQMRAFLLGFIAPTSPPTGYIHLVGIHPDYRRRGIGKELYSQFARRCRAAGASRLKAIATMRHEQAARFHSSLGFEVREEPDYAGQGCARLVFAKPL